MNENSNSGRKWNASHRHIIALTHIILHLESCMEYNSNKGKQLELVALSVFIQIIGSGKILLAVLL